MNQYNVTVELGVDVAELDALEQAIEPLARDFAAVLHAAPDGRAAVTLTVRHVGPLGALAEAVGLLGGCYLELYAVAVLPTDEYDRRAGAASGPMLSVPQAAERLGISEQRVRQLLTGSKLDGEKVGRDWLVTEDSVSRRPSPRSWWPRRSAPSTWPTSTGRTA
jgi:excisionase family DNA binding protein